MSVEVTEGTVCAGCGLPAVIRVDDQNLCGNCYFVSLSLREGLRRRQAQGGTKTREEDLERTIVAAVEEIRRLRQRVDELVHTTRLGRNGDHELRDSENPGGPESSRGPENSEFRIQSSK